MLWTLVKSAEASMEEAPALLYFRARNIFSLARENPFTNFSTELEFSVMTGEATSRAIA